MKITGQDIGFYLLLIIIGLFGAALIFRQVTAETSYGLHELFGILATIGGFFMRGYLPMVREKKPEEQKQNG
jgi:hypothetical protein